MKKYQTGFAPLLLLFIGALALGTFVISRSYIKEAVPKSEVLSAQTSFGSPLPEGLLKSPSPEMLKRLNLTDEQKTEIKTRLAAIEAKKKELKSLQESFLSWLKTNNLPPGLFMNASQTAKPSGSPHPELNNFFRKESPHPSSSPISVF